MILTGGLVFTEQGEFEGKDIYIEGEKIVSSIDELTDQTKVDVSGYKILPGLIDVHSHGAMGHDFGDTSVENLKEILKFQLKHGITSYCPTSMTLSKDMLKEIFQTVTKVEPSKDYADIAGINMEGPFISMEKKGAQNKDYVSKPDIQFFQECMEASGNKIKLITIAPEIEGALELIKEISKVTNVSIGHSNAEYDDTKKAFLAGASHITHLYNAMPPLHHRKPGVIGAALENENCMVELISDGFHIHPAMVRDTFHMFGGDRVVLISDSMRAAGLESGTFELGGQMVTVKDGKALLSDGTIAASITNLYDCMCRAISFGIKEQDAIFAATRNPAKSIGIYEHTGSIVPGKVADLLVVDQEYKLHKICHLGQFSK
ncbi:MAG: N-acetylglucosamine-6-phosphate deacetylase [Anaerostipes sp.]|nr:N-acetylglucosamine-6-phosphate deacetylase [Anaerostipes sp.]